MKGSFVLREAIRPHLGILSVAAGCTLVVTGLSLAVPFVFGRTIDELIARSDFRLIERAGLGVLGILTLRTAFLYGSVYANLAFAHRATARLRDRLFSALLRWPLPRLGDWHSGEVLSRSLSDTQLVHTHLLLGLVDLLGTVASLVGTVAMLFVLHWQLAAITLAILPAVALVARHYGAQIQRTSARAQQQVAELASRMREVVAGARVVRAFVQEAREEARFSEENARLVQQQLQTSRLVAREVCAVTLATALGLVGFLWIGARLVASGWMSPGSLVAFIAYVALAIEPGISLTRMYANLRQAQAALDRIEEVLRVPIHADPPGARDLPRPAGDIVYEDVWLTYEPGRWALRGVTFRIRSGERVALVGPSGSGKTSVVNLLLRFYDPTRGRITVGGVDLREVRVASLRARIGYVPQDPILFAGTVRENIAYGRPKATLEEVIRAARAAHADEFIQALPQGYDTPVGEAGQNLSGGQRQRLAIARALLLDPEIIVLDEATSQLDAEAEATIRQALQQLFRGRTVLVIAHRLSTVREVDRILVLRAGRVVEEGTYEELVRAGGLFRSLVAEQLLTVPGS